MNLPFFESKLQHMGIGMPNDKLRELQQASIDSTWEVTTAKYLVEEQDNFDEFTFHNVEVWFDYVVGVTSTFMKNGNDFRKLIFRDIDHSCLRGLYYKFDESYWLTDFTDPMITVQKFVTVRRCNNWLRIIDPENGKLVTYPCVIDYDASSPSPQISSSVITPNNHLSVMVQGNAETLRLFTLNKRFLFGGRPFKILAYQNALMPVDGAKDTNILYLDMYLDEIHGLDDLDNNLAYNGTYDYKISIQADSQLVTENLQGVLLADVMLNDNEVQRPILWESDNEQAITISPNGEYNVVGVVGQSANITATIEGNPDVKNTITLTIGKKEDISAKIILNPVFDSVRQYEKIEFEVMASYDGKVYSQDELEHTQIIINSDAVSFQDLGGNNYVITGLKVNKEPIKLICNVRNNNPAFESTSTFEIKATSMLG